MLRGGGRQLTPARPTKLLPARPHVVSIGTSLSSRKRQRFIPASSSICLKTEGRLASTNSGRRGPSTKLPALPPHYVIGEFLGRGSHGQVKALHDASTNQQFAVKIMAKNNSSSKDQRHLRKEVFMWKKICSTTRYAAKLEGVYEDTENWYLVQELCVGGTLEDLLAAHGPLSEPELAQVGHAILSFLEDCHSQHVLHGDIKPANFLIKGLYPSLRHLLNPASPKGSIEIKAIDFGTCEVTSPTGSLKEVVGSPIYCAPEVISRSYNLPADVWSAAVLLYQLGCNHLPFWSQPMDSIDDSLDMVDMYSDIQCVPAIIAGERWCDRSEELMDLLCKLLDKNPQTRLTAQEALQHPWFGMFGLNGAAQLA